MESTILENELTKEQRRELDNFLDDLEEERIYFENRKAKQFKDKGFTWLAKKEMKNE